MKVENRSWKHTGKRGLGTTAGTPITPMSIRDRWKQIPAAEIGGLGRAKAAGSEGRPFERATGLHCATRLHTARGPRGAAIHPGD
jgi:hypothetical protein